MVALVTAYSDQSKRLAQQVVARAAKNLSRSGKTVHRDVKSGRYVVTKAGGGEIRTTDRHGNDSGSTSKG